MAAPNIEHRRAGLPDRRRGTRTARCAAAGLTAGTALLLALAANADSTPLPISAGRVHALVPTALDRPGDSSAPQKTEGHARPGSVCTFATCRPREADPARGALAFGGTALVAGIIARRRSPRNR